MLTEEYKAWQPWKCHSCSAELQFSKTHGSLLQLCLFGVALLLLYVLGVRGWQLAVGAVVGGFLAAVVLAGPLDRIIPPRLEAYQPPPWKENRFATLFPRDGADSDDAKQVGGVGRDSSKDPESADYLRKEKGQ
jgi:hypothetical protein